MGWETSGRTGKKKEGEGKDGEGDASKYWSGRWP